jgi:hypothetical protein
MANIRVSYALSSTLVAAVSTVAIGVSAAGGATVTARPQQNIQISAFVVPMEYLEEQTVIMSDFRQLLVTKEIADPADSVVPTEQITLQPGLALTDSVTMYDVVYKDVTEVVDYDRNDADVDPDPVTASDTSTRSVGKTLTDSATASDSAPVFAQNKTTTDTVTASDIVNTKDVGKTLTDTATASDASPVFDASKVVADSASATDAAALSVDKGGIADTATATDSSSLQPSLAKTDSVTAADTLNSFNIGKNPSDSVTASDTVNSFAIQTVLTDSVTITDVVYKDFTEMVDYDRNDADVDPDPVTVADVSIRSISPVYTDSVTMADALAKVSSKVLTDSATAADSVSILLIPGVTTPLYDFAFASDEKFTYQWTLGTINSHLIHQPLVNGEFVLTTNPNAGIVYTMRTESVEYTYNGYELNGNQLN